MVSLFIMKGMKMLKRAVKRNIDRFPDDFMFELNEKEFKDLRCQIGTSKSGRGGRRYLPYAFSLNLETEAKPRKIYPVKLVREAI